jgi:hypothetical protein
MPSRCRCTVLLAGSSTVRLHESRAAEGHVDDTFYIDQQELGALLDVSNP